jgi:hypothetical protein
LTNGGNVSDGKNFRIPSYAKPGCYCLSVKEDGITIVSRDFEGYGYADFTPEQKRQIEEYHKKLEARRVTQEDEKAINEVYRTPPEIITPKAPDCGPANAASSRP